MLRRLPTFLNGSQHTQMRKEMALLIAAAKEFQFEAARRTVASIFETTLRPGATVDAVSDVARPLYRAFSSALLRSVSLGSSDAALDLVEDLPVQLDPLSSLARRHGIEKRLRAFLDHNAGRPDGGLTPLCLAMLGARPFVGSVALSIHAVIAANSGKPSCSIAWPEHLIVSSLRFADRIATEDTDLEGIRVSRGERIRCVIHDGSYAADDNRPLLFGVGAHTCLGKPLTQTCWSLLRQNFLQRRDAFFPGDLEIAASKQPFCTPLHAFFRIA